jgi:hypothetical protein
MSEMFKDKVNRSQPSETLAEFWNKLLLATRKSPQIARKINIRENGMSNQEWTIQRHWQHWASKT